MIRNVVFTGSQAIILVCYIGTIGEQRLLAFGIALFGIVLSIIWRAYYRASLYWAWFWEYRCRQINDRLVDLLGLDVDLFAGHPAGKYVKEPPSFMFGGRMITHTEIHRTLKAVPVAFFFLWLVLAIAACISFHKEEVSPLPIAMRYVISICTLHLL